MRMNTEPVGTCMKQTKSEENSIMLGLWRLPHLIWYGIKRERQVIEQREKVQDQKRWRVGSWWDWKGGDLNTFWMGEREVTGDPGREKCTDYKNEGCSRTLWEAQMRILPTANKTTKTSLRNLLSLIPCDSRNFGPRSPLLQQNTLFIDDNANRGTCGE